MWGSHEGADIVWMSLMMTLFWLPILVIVVWILREFVRSSRGDSGRPTPTEADAIELARRSYARGEIDRARYLEIIGDLTPSDD